MKRTRRLVNAEIAHRQGAARARVHRDAPTIQLSNQGGMHRHRYGSHPACEWKVKALRLERIRPGPQVQPTLMKYGRQRDRIPVFVKDLKNLSRNTYFS